MNSQEEEEENLLGLSYFLYNTHQIHLQACYGEGKAWTDSRAFKWKLLGNTLCRLDFHHSFGSGNSSPRRERNVGLIIQTVMIQTAVIEPKPCICQFWLFFNILKVWNNDLHNGSLWIQLSYFRAAQNVHQCHTLHQMTSQVKQCRTHFDQRWSAERIEQED